MSHCLELLLLLAKVGVPGDQVSLVQNTGGQFGNFKRFGPNDSASKEKKSRILYLVLVTDNIQEFIQ